MKVSEIKNSISTLPGVGPKIAGLFAGLNIFTAGDLLQFYPRNWEDRTKKIPLSSALSVSKVHTIAKVTGHEWFGYGRMKTLKILINDGTAGAELVAFNRAFLEKSLPAGSIISVTGRFEEKYGKLQSSSFEAQKISDGGEIFQFAHVLPPDSRIIPLYRLTEGLTQKTVQKAVNSALQQYALGIEDELDQSIIEKRGLLHKKQALEYIHNPPSFEDWKKARDTLAYEELFFFQTAVAKQSLEHRGKLPALEVLSAGADTLTGTAETYSPEKAPEQDEHLDEDFIKSLSPRQKQYLSRLTFELTSDQKKVIAALNKDIDSSYETSMTGKLNGEKSFSMRSLLQGDVGSGKTLVSFFACLRVIDYGSQAAIMAPTEILARQHALNASAELESLGVRPAFLTGNINARGRNLLLNALKDGTVNLVIGTHALFSKNVVYRDLALAVIDEQHRFGVMQRSAIIDKGRTSLEPKINEPNLLMMSATPIPQTLALTAFGDLDILTIKSMPQGRKTIQTYLNKQGNEARAYEAVRTELKKGRQAYFVYPAIEAAFEEDSHNSPSLKATEEAFSFLKNQVYPEYRCALIHSKINEEEQAKILEDFKAGIINILVATTVVEVGVNVPNATCMVIENADRFGLAALHQLRGRVGRGAEQSYCFLIYSKNITENGIARMKAIRETTDGFKIAEEDLKLRGPGEITGTAQSGEISFALADLYKDQKLLMQSRQDAFEKLMSRQ